MFVYNGFTHDARVLKEAQALSGAGYSVTVAAVQEKELKTEERLGDLRVLRVPKNGLHVSLANWAKSFVPRNAPGVPGISRPLGESAGASDERQNLRMLIGVLLSPILLPVYWLWLCCSASARQAEYPVLPIRSSDITTATRIVSQAIRLALRKLLSLAYRVLTPFHRQLFFLDYYRRCRRLLKDKGFAVYHAHDLNTLPIAWWLARKRDARLVYDSHEYYLERNRIHVYTAFEKWWRTKLEGFLVRRADLNITVNESIGKALGETYGVAPFRVIMNAPSRAMAIEHGTGRSIKEALGIANDKRILLYLGAITFNRGLEKVIESLRHLDDCRLVMMGYGKTEFKETLSELAKQLGVQERMHFFGPVPSSEVTSYACTADIGVAAIKNVCLSYFYCSPNKLFEYLLSGLPIIASDFPELKKVVEDYKVGLTFDPEDPRDIAAKARKILDTPGFIEQVRSHADAAADDFNWENESAKLISYYGEMTPESCR